MKQKKLLGLSWVFLFCLALIAKQSLIENKVFTLKNNDPEQEPEFITTAQSELSRFITAGRYLNVKDNKLEVRSSDSNENNLVAEFKTEQGLLFAPGENGFALVSKAENKVFYYDHNGNKVWDKAFSLPIKGVSLDNGFCYLHLGSPWGLAEDKEDGKSFPLEKIVAYTLEDGKSDWEYNLKGETILSLKPGKNQNNLALFTLNLTGERAKCSFHLLDQKGTTKQLLNYGENIVYDAVNYQQGQGWIGLGKFSIHFFTYDGLRLWSKQLLSQPLLVCEFGAGEFIIVESDKITCIDQQCKLIWEKKVKNLGGKLIARNFAQTIALGGKNNVYLLNRKGKILKTVHLKSGVEDLFFNEQGQLLVLEESDTVTTIQLKGENK